MAEKLYIVCSIGYEYNDEIYSRGEGDHANPVTAYRLKDVAEAEANKRNLAEFRRNNMEEYCYGVDELFKRGGYNRRTGTNELPEEVLKYNFDEAEDVTTFMKNASDDEIVELIQFMRLSFFEVREIELVT